MFLWVSRLSVNPIAAILLAYVCGILSAGPRPSVNEVDVDTYAFMEKQQLSTVSLLGLLGEDPKQLIFSLSEWIQAGGLPTKSFERMKDRYLPLNSIPLRTFNASELIFNPSVMDAFDPQVPEELQGIWYTSDHPTFGAAFVSFVERFDVDAFIFHHEGNVRHSVAQTSSWFLGKAGSWSVSDSEANRASLRFHYKHKSMFAFPRFEANSFSEYLMRPGNSSLDTFVLTRMDSPFEQAYFPAGILEGFNSTLQRVWNPDTDPRDIASCFCSLHFYPDQIDRWNYGKPSYTLHRIIGPKGYTHYALTKFLKLPPNLTFVRIA